MKITHHVIPVPFGMSPEMSWEYLQRGHRFVYNEDDPEPSWVVVETREGRLYKIHPASEDENGEPTGPAPESDFFE